MDVTSNWDWELELDSNWILPSAAIQIGTRHRRNAKEAEEEEKNPVGSVASSLPEREKKERVNLPARQSRSVSQGVVSGWQRGLQVWLGCQSVSQSVSQSVKQTDRRAGRLAGRQASQVRQLYSAQSRHSPSSYPPFSATLVSSTDT